MNKILKLFKKIFQEKKIKELIIIEPFVDRTFQLRKPRKKRITKHLLVKNHLVEKEFIDSWTAINLYGATRLSAIIFNLRKQGFDIKSHSCSAYDRNNNNCNFTKYTLKK